MQKVRFNIFGCYALSAFMFLIFNVAFVKVAYAQEIIEDQKAPETPDGLSGVVAKSWEALAKNEQDKVCAYAKQVVDAYGLEARQQQKSLNGFPAAEKTKNYDILNNVATCLFIKGEALLKEDKVEESKEVFRLILSDYSFAQAWDPRGWYWKVAEKSQATLDKLEKGLDAIEKQCSENDKYQGVAWTKIVLYDVGKEDVVDYAKYGDFVGVGTKNYKYIIKSQEGLSEAVGEGIYPNTTSVRWDPAFRQVREEKRLEGNHWDFVYSPDLEAAFIKWAISPEPQGIKLFYTGLILEKSGSIKHAIKTYYAIVVHFPHTVGWTYWHTPWYVGQAAIARIKYLCAKYPQLNMSLIDTKISVINGFDNDVSNDIFVTNPGKIVMNHIPETLFDRIKKYIDKRVAQTKIKRKLGEGKVRFVQYENGDWQLLVNNRPYIIKGITYAVAKVGQSPDNGSLKGWMEYDYNKNGKCDGPYDSFVDTNGNGNQDHDEPSIGDFELMKRLGVNTVRIYHQPYDIDKKILRDLYNRYGIRVIMGDFLGKYAIGSGATWFDGTDYDNEEQRKTMLESIRKMVKEFKDEPYILVWLLGNENVYGVACNADKKPDSFFKFVNEAACLIKSLDKNHPVAIASGDTLFLDQYAQYCPDVDMFGANVYRGESGFGSYWESVKELANKPAFITEYGCPAFAYGLSKEEAEDAQAEYLKSNWNDIMDNSAFASGCGNAIGGVLFEWLDEWWKAYEPSFHDKKGLFKGPFPDGSMHEEWLGVTGQGDGTKSPFLRELRKSYSEYQKLWKK